MRILLVSVIGALALAGILLRATMSYFSRRKRRNTPRRPIWDDAINDRQLPFEPPASPYAQRVPTRPVQYANANRRREDDDEIEYLLRRAARRR